MEYIRNSLGRVRKETLNGRDYLVAPMSMISPGVLPGSKGALYYSLQEISKEPHIWNHTPILVGHPEKDGLHVSGRDPYVIERQGIGHVYNSHAGAKLVAEGWFDVENTQRIEPRILQSLRAGRPIELSTGLFTDNEPSLGTHNGKRYDFIARNYRPDHLAILPDTTGACILPGQRVEGRFVRGSKARYAGEAVRLKTASGEVLAVTANHPVLTSAGFVPAGQIAEGEDLLHYVGEDESLAANGDKQDAPALVEDVFDALERLGSIHEPAGTRASPLDFHGDAAFFQGNVQIVGAKRTLRDNLVTEPSQRFDERSFGRGRHGEAQLAGSGHALEFFDRVDAAHAGTVGGSCELLALCQTELGIHGLRRFGGTARQPKFLDCAVDGAGRRPSLNSRDSGTAASLVGGYGVLDSAGRNGGVSGLDLAALCVVGPGAELDVTLAKLGADGADVGATHGGDVLDGMPSSVVGNPDVNHVFGGALTGRNAGACFADGDALPRQHLSDRRDAEARLFRQLPQSFPGKVRMDKVVGVERFFHDGPVYDFETVTGYMVAEKLIVSNCSIKDGCGVLVNSRKPKCPT